LTAPLVAKLAPPVAQIMLLTIDIAQQTNWRFLFNVDVHFFVQRQVWFFTVAKFLLLGL